MWDAVIGAGASILGGIFGKSKKPKEKSAEQNSREAIFGQASRARDAGEKYGFNPLTLLGASSALGPSYSESANYMGNAIADAGMILADGLAKKKEAGQLSQLKEQNEKLRKQIQDQTLRPKVGGIYARRQATPTMAQALGRSNVGNSRDNSDLGSSGGNNPSDLRPLPETYGVDPRREVDQKKIEPHSGFMVVDNPYLPKLYFPTLDGDEGLSVTQLPLIPWAWAGSAVAQRVQNEIDYRRGERLRPKPKSKSSEYIKRTRGTGPRANHPVYPPGRAP